MAGLHSITVFTKAVTFMPGDTIAELGNWERVCIPDYVMYATLDIVLPPSGKSFTEIEQNMSNMRRRWYLLLNIQGYTAVKLQIEGMCVFAEATKDKVKG